MALKWKKFWKIAVILIALLFFAGRFFSLPISENPLQDPGSFVYAALHPMSMGSGNTSLSYINFINRNFNNILIASLAILALLAYRATRRSSLNAFIYENKEGALYGIVAMLAINIYLTWPQFAMVLQGNTSNLPQLKMFMLAAGLIGLVGGTIFDMMRPEGKWL